VRQDLLDKVVWTEIVRLLENPQLIQNELDRRLAAARDADPSKRREEALRRELVRISKSIDRLLTAYQEGFLSLDELRERMPNLRRREQVDNAELQAIVNQSVDRATYLRLAETLTTFLTRLRSSANALDVSERQRVLRLLVKEILVSDDKIIIRHCIPLPTGSGDGLSAQSAGAAIPSTAGYLLRSRSLGASVPQIMDEGILACPCDLPVDGEVAARGEITPRIAALAPAELQIMMHRIHPGRGDVRMGLKIPLLIDTALTARELDVAQGLRRLRFAGMRGTFRAQVMGKGIPSRPRDVFVVGQVSAG
jgi:hypothetical protein